MATITEDFTLTGWPWAGWRVALSGAYTAWNHDEAADDIRSTGLASTALAYRNGEVWPATQASKVTLALPDVPNSASSTHYGAVCRVQPDHSGILFMVGGTATVVVAQLFLIDSAGARTSISTGEVVPHFEPNDYIQLTIAGGFLIGTINGVAITGQTIAEPAAANDWGTPGFYAWAGGADLLRIGEFVGTPQAGADIGTFPLNRKGINMPGGLNIGKDGLIL